MARIVLSLLGFLTEILNHSVKPQQSTGVSTEMVRKIVGGIVACSLLLIVFANSLLLTLADVLWQQHQSGVIAWTPTLITGLAGLIVPVLLFAFYLKPQSFRMQAEQPQEPQQHHFAPVATALSHLIEQYTEERRASAKQQQFAEAHSENSNYAPFKRDEFSA